MSGPNAMDDEMSGFSFPGRPGDEPLLDMVFDRRPLPPEAPAEIHGLAQLLVALAGPAEPGELAGEAAARGAFTRVASPAGVLSAGVLSAGRRARRHRPSRRLRRGRVRLAAALLTMAAGVGSLAAAYTGVLPSSVQEVAHTVAGSLAPAPRTHQHHDPARPAAANAPRDTRPQPSPARPHPSPRPRLGPAHPHRIDQYAGNATIPNPIFDHGSPRPSYGPPTRSCATPGPRPAPGSAGCTPTPTPTPARTPAPTASPRRL